jgi:DNA-binding response OmpR family regulator
VVARPRKTERLDKVLMRLGYATQAQIQEAVKRQSARGGRVGKNLVELGAITDDQLFDALVEQFRLPTTRLEESSVTRDLLDRMPPGVVSNHLMLPLAWDPDRRVLSLVVANPADEETVEVVRQAFGAQTVRLSLAQERMLAGLAARLTAGGDEPRPDVRMVHLPELFGAAEAAPVEREASPVERILMVTSGSARKNFLPPIFEREGRRLIVATTAEEVVEALADGPVSAVLVSEEMKDVFGRWRVEGRVQDPESEVRVFSGVSSALLDNPLPYAGVSKSLRRAVQALAQHRAAAHGVRPPYGLMANDVEALAHALRIRTVVVDAMNLGLHLLLPPHKRTKGTGKPATPFHAFASSSELAAGLRFPWDLGKLLGTCGRLYTGGLKPDGDADPELLQAAQVLAIVWYRHVLLDTADAGLGDEGLALRTALRNAAGRLATLEVIEEYLQLLTERGGLAAASERRVLLVGGPRITRSLAPALERVACAVAAAVDLTAAQEVADQESPAAIVIDHEVFGDEVAKFGRIMKLGGGSLLFVLTDSADQALVLNLLDIGVDDVFGPPHDFDLVAARVNRAIRSRASRPAADAAPAGQFSATFEHFSFLDLAQMLSHGFKTVRVDLWKSDGEEAELYMQKGRIVHAECGKVSGPEAVYRVIAWEADGQFTVREESDFPTPTIEAPTESLLMEGCRRLDEGRR